MRGCCNPTRKIMPENEGPGQVLFYEWKCVARGLTIEPFLGNVIGGGTLGTLLGAGGGALLGALVAHGARGRGAQAAEAGR